MADEMFEAWVAHMEQRLTAEQIFASWDEYGKLHHEWREQREREIEQAEAVIRARRATFGLSYEDFTLEDLH